MSDKRNAASSKKDQLKGAIRSEEHTSELQSRPHLVCRLLLEKTKTQRQRSRSTSPRSAKWWSRSRCFLTDRPHPASHLFPYTTLFRSTCRVLTQDFLLMARRAPERMKEHTVVCD